jgi:ATP-dependent DNA ligase
MEELPKYDTLFSLDKSGKIRFYLQTLEYVDDGQYYRLSSSTGLWLGKPTTSITRITKAKRNNTLYEQAVIQANSSFNDKKNEGYKTEQDLRDFAIARDIELPEDITPSQMFQFLKIKYNTDTRWYPLPMLAEKYAPHKKKVAFPGFVQPKLNGVRCLALWDQDDNCVVLVSRGGKTYFIPHIEKQLKPFFQTNPHIILDGELYCHGKRLQHISGAARREKDAPEWLEYHVYDMISDAHQSERLVQASANVFILRSQWGAKDIHFVQPYSISSHEQIKEWHDSFVMNGYEGAMYRNPNGKYGVSFRVTDLLKVKEFIDEEFEIVGCKTDPDKTVGESFVFILKNDLNDETFEARPTGSVRDKETWYSRIDSLLGKKATVRYQERTAKELPHQGHVRADNTSCLTIEEVDPLK